MPPMPCRRFIPTFSLLALACAGELTPGQEPDTCDEPTGDCTPSLFQADVSRAGTSLWPVAAEALAVRSVWSVRLGESVSFLQDVGAVEGAAVSSVLEKIGATKKNVFKIQLNCTLAPAKMKKTPTDYAEEIDRCCPSKGSIICNAHDTEMPAGVYECVGDPPSTDELANTYCFESQSSVALPTVLVEVPEGVEFEEASARLAVLQERLAGRARIVPPPSLEQEEIIIGGSMLVVFMLGAAYSPVIR